jgi:16S rRNA (guanine527-N7)-methyltransferase
MIGLEPLLAPFLLPPLSAEQLQQLRVYLDLLLKWNAKISLSAVREPEQIVRRHFGESLFTGAHLQAKENSGLADLGSGAGSPGLPIAIQHPEMKITLIESQQKKVAFLRETIRAVGIRNASVYAGRAEDSKIESQIVTMRAVEKFDVSVATAASLVARGGQLVLLIGSAQAQNARSLLPKVRWKEPIDIPESRERVLLIGIQDQP